MFKTNRVIMWKACTKVENKTTLKNFSPRNQTYLSAYLLLSFKHIIWLCIFCLFSSNNKIIGSRVRALNTVSQVSGNRQLITFIFPESLCITYESWVARAYQVFIPCFYSLPYNITYKFQALRIKETDRRTKVQRNRRPQSRLVRRTGGHKKS